jgi:hypothetical protein
MAEGVVSLDPDEADAAIARWRAYGDSVHRHGALDPGLVSQLRETLGDTYAEFIDAKVLEQQARAGAYQRVAAQAHAHADKLANTRNNLRSGDEDVAQTLNRINTD